jgi:hypothetical protein
MMTLKELENISQKCIHIWLQRFMEEEDIVNFEVEWIPGQACGTKFPEILHK